MRPVALLVGIESYPHLAHALGRPSASLDLPGAPRDVARMAACCMRLGADPDDVRVLSGEVDSDQLLEGLRWLAARLAEPGTAGLFHFSGHGVRAGRDGWSLVTSEVGAIGFAALTLEQVRDELDHLAPGRDLTVLLDACADEDLDLASMLPRDAVLYLGDSRTPEITLGSTRQGALSWAFATVLERWTHDQGGLTTPRAAIGAAGLLDVLHTGVTLRVARLSGAHFMHGRSGERAEPAPAAAYRQLNPDIEGYKQTLDDGTTLIGWLWVDTAIDKDRWNQANPVPGPYPDVWRLYPPEPGRPPGPAGYNDYPHAPFGPAGPSGPVNPGPNDKLWVGRKFHGTKQLMGEVWLLQRNAKNSWPASKIEWWCTPNFLPPGQDLIFLGEDEYIRFSPASQVPGGPKRKMPQP